MKKNYLRILDIDPYLHSYEKDLILRMDNYTRKKEELIGKKGRLSAFANGYKYFGFHRTRTGWVYREWAPAAEAIYLTGDFNEWNSRSHAMTALDNGVWEIEIKGKDTLKPGQKIQALIIHNGNELRRIPTYATRVVQDPDTILWCAEIEDTMKSYPWTDKDFVPEKTPFIYECHIGMAQEKYGIGTYEEFKNNTLPRIKELGYNTIQIMAIMEHPYYGSFGYQVSNFFAASSKYGRSEELKALINTAHEMGIAEL